MIDHNLSISLQDVQGPSLWQIKDLPPPDDMDEGISVYKGQRNVENLLKTLNQRIYKERDESLLPYLFDIFERSIEHGVEDIGIIQWDDRSHYTRISWTGYSWKLPRDIKKRKVSVRISKPEEEDIIGEFNVPLSKIADDGGDIVIAPRIVSKMNLKKGNSVNVIMKFIE